MSSQIEFDDEVADYQKGAGEERDRVVRIYLLVAVVILGILAFFIWSSYFAQKYLPSPLCNDSRIPDYYYDSQGNLIKIDYGEPCEYGIKSLNYFYDDNRFNYELRILNINSNHYYLNKTYSNAPVKNDIKIDEKSYIYGTGGLYTVNDNSGNTFYLSPDDYSSLLTKDELMNLVRRCEGDCGEININQSDYSSQ